MPEERIPVIRLREYLLVSVQIELTDRIVQQLREDVTRTVAATGARGLIIDVTGTDFMDSYISRTLRDISVATRLMGVPTVLCGMHPAVAMTMVEMGIELKGVPMALNLDAATALLERERRDREAGGDLPDDAAHGDAAVIDDLLAGDQAGDDLVD